jgi:uncharacterized membrane protein HdeD (DUF308 family)
MIKKILNKNPLWFLGAGILSVVLHNAFYAVFGFEEAIFFLLTFVFAIIFIIGVIYKIIRFCRK